MREGDNNESMWAGRGACAGAVELFLDLLLYFSELSHSSDVHSMLVGERGAGN